ncbi:MAG: DUF4124 domain-containing protein [Rhodanobacteraceae bacterium]
MEIGTGYQQHGLCMAGTLTCALFLVLLACVATDAHAASIYKCVGANGGITFRDTACTAHARQTKLDVAGQPLIDPSAPPQTAPTRSQRHSTAHSHRTRAKHHPHSRQHKSPMSWECRAADGEVFYRHKRCPSSVRGDGVVRSAYAETFIGRHSRRHHTAWDRVPVHGKKIPREEACHRIHTAGAAGRDGHLRDAKVSTYDHLMGRDPCTDGG